MVAGESIMEDETIEPVEGAVTPEFYSEDEVAAVLDGGPSATQDDGPQKVNIGEAEYTLDEAEKLISMGKDATAKWEEAAAIKRKLAEVEPLLNAIQELDDDGVTQLRHVFEKKRGVPEVEAPREWASEQEQFLYERNKALEATLNKTLSVVDQLNRKMTQIEMAPVIAEVARKYADHIPGLTAEGVQEAMQKTGISNPEYATSAYYFHKAKESAHLNGHQQAKRPKPEIGSNKVKSVKLSDLKTPDAIEKAISLNIPIIDDSGF